MPRKNKEIDVKVKEIPELNIKKDNLQKYMNISLIIVNLILIGTNIYALIFAIPNYFKPQIINFTANETAYQVIHIGTCVSVCITRHATNQTTCLPTNCS